ncbi:MAG: hypothetical protein M1318_07490 [Firmicutes bacterium]|nr:hypothetical protein [Bacillota bacterium]
MVLGVIIAVIFPIVVALYLPHKISGVPTGVSYPVLFGAVTMAGQLGLWLKNADPKKAVQAMPRDVAIAMVAGAAAYGATRLALLQGGGPTDPALLAVACGYLLMMWPHYSPTR